MKDILLICGGLCVLAWVYLLLLHGQFWQVQRWKAPKALNSPMSGLVAAVIPARNEAASVGLAVRSLLNQDCAEDLRVFVVDDNSTDGTAAAARAAAPGARDQSKLTVIAGRPLPSGWTGKLWAVQQGVEQALKLGPQFLLLTDADVDHAPDNISKLVSIAERGQYDLVSFMVMLHCESLAEKLLIPAFVFFFFMLYPPAWIRSPHRRTAGAAGGCMLIRPEVLEQAGGIAAIRNEIIDDCALAARVKSSGGRVWPGLTPNTRSLRAYRTFGEIERMIARTAFNQLHHSLWVLLGAAFALVLIFLVPLVLLFSGARWPGTLGLTAYLLMSLAYLPMVRFYNLGIGWCLTLPFSALFYISATLHSAVKFWRGRGGEWKGRPQDQSASA